MKKLVLLLTPVTALASSEFDLAYLRGIQGQIERLSTWEDTSKEALKVDHRIYLSQERFKLCSREARLRSMKITSCYKYLDEVSDLLDLRSHIFRGE